MLSASALQSWSLVNKHAYILTLRRRYRSVRFQTPSAAYAFSHHRLHTSLGSPRHVRNAFVNLPSSLSRCDLEKYALAIQPIPAAALRTFSVHIGNGATYSSWALPLLLGAESHIRALRVKSRNESWFGVFDCTTFTQLRSLELRTTNQVFSAPQYSTLLRVALQCTAKTLTSLDIGHATTSTAAELHTSPGLNPLRGFISQSSLDRAAAPHHPHLECLAFRDLDFGSAEAFDWSIFGAHGPETLRLLQCYNLAPMLETTMRNLLPTWRDLTALDFVLPNMRMQTHPASLAALEDALCCCAAANLGLKHLRVEIPAAGRTPDARAIALHGNLESLVVGVTDADGRWLPFEADELQTVIEGCMRLQLVGLILPPVGTDSEYYLVSSLSPIFSYLTDHIEDLSSPSPTPVPRPNRRRRRSFQTSVLPSMAALRPPRHPGRRGLGALSLQIAGPGTVVVGEYHFRRACWSILLRHLDRGASLLRSRW